MEKRDTYFDSVKFVLIFLVVFGHFLEVYKETDKTILAIYNLKATFNMPLFIFVSGYFSKRLNFTKIKKSILPTLDTLITFQLLLGIIPALKHGVYDSYMLYRPYWYLWYLPSLLFWKIALYYFFIKRNNKNKAAKTIMFFLFAILIGILPFVGKDFSLSRTIVFFPFFIMGYLTTQKEIDLVKRIPKFISIICIALLFVLFYKYSNIGLFSLLSGAESYETIMASDLFTGFNLPSNSFVMLLRIVQFILAVILSICVLNLTFDNPLFALLGEKTMFFYIYHGFFIMIFTKICNTVLCTPNAFILFLVTCLVFTLIYIATFLKMTKLFLTPISSIRRAIKERGL